MQARRYNKGKLRYELLPEKALKDLVEVYTKGAEKYTVYNEDGSIKDDGANNWRKGLPWMSMLGSIERHIHAFKMGEDIDPDLGTKHLANAAWGLLSLLEYYKIYPQGDDREHGYLSNLKIGLDIDEVICGWVSAWCEKFNIKIPQVWSFSYSNKDKFKLLSESGQLDEFYLNLPRIIDPKELPFEPHCYITSRSVPVELTMQWLENNGFPCKPVHSVGFGESKIEAAKASGIDVFVDDYYSNFIELNKAGICTYLYDAPHNQRYNVGYKRLYDLKDLI